MPQKGVLCGLSTPWGPLWVQEIWDFYRMRRIPRRINCEKISNLRRGQTRHFWEKPVFFNFSRFLPKYRISVYISIIYAPKERRLTSVDPQGVVGNYDLSIFLKIYQVDESRNQKCGTHIKKLTAVKFRNSGKLSYRSNQLGKVYLDKNKNWVNVQKSNYRGTYFYFFIFFLLKLFVFENFEKPRADSERQYPTFYKSVSTDSS